MTDPTWPVAPTTPTRTPPVEEAEEEEEATSDMAKTLTVCQVRHPRGFRSDAVSVPDASGRLPLMPRRPQLVPWKAAGRLSETQASGDDVVRTTGWVFNNETGSDLTLEEFVATGDAEVSAYLTVFGLRSPASEEETLVEIGCGIGRMTCGFTREYGTVVACDVDPGFLERCFETVGRFGKVDRLRTSRVTDGKTLELEPNSGDVAFSYITLQHCDPDDALELTAEAVRVTRPGGKIVLNYRSRGGMDWLLLPIGHNCPLEDTARIWGS